MQVGTARISISFIAFTPLLLYRYKEIPFNKLLPLLIVGVCGSGLPAILYSIGQVHVPSAIAGVLNSLTPIFTFVLAVLFYKQKFILAQLGGIALALIGIVLLFFIKEKGSADFPFFYAALIILATIFYAVSANTVSTFLQGVKPILISTISFALIGPIALVYLLSSDFISVTMTHEKGIHSIVALILLSILGTFTANILFFRLIQMTGAIFSTSVAFLIPFVALMWGFVDGEALSMWHVVSLFLILCGIYLIRKFK